MFWHAIHHKKKRWQAVLFVALLVLLMPFAVNGQMLLPADGMSASDALALGRKAYDQGNMQEAFKYFQRTIELDATSVEGHYRLGQVYWGMRQGQKAVEHFDKAGALGEKNSSLHMSLASFYEKVRMKEKAVEHYRRVITIEGDTPLGKEAEKNLNLVLVKNYAEADDVDTALQLLQSMLEEYPNDARVLQHLGFAYLLANRFESAAAIYDEVLDKDPNNDSAHMNIAGVYEKMGNFEAAIKHFTLASDLASDPVRQVEARVRAGMLSAETHQKNGNAQAAIDDLKALLELKPDLTVVSNRLSRLYSDEGRSAEAQRVLEDALMLLPDVLDVRTNLALIYVQEKNYLDAIRMLGFILQANEGKNPFVDRAKDMMQFIANTLGPEFQNVAQAALKKNNLLIYVAENPNEARAHFDLGVIYVGQNRHDLALKHFERVVELMPTNVYAHLYLGEIYNALNENKKASEAYARYISLEPDVSKLERLTVVYASSLARYLLEEQQYNASLHQFQRVVAESEDAYSWYQIGVLLAQRGELEEAIDAYTKVLTLLPSNTIARFNRAMVYEQLGRESEAFDEYKQVAIAEKQNELLIDAAESKVDILKARLNGMTAAASYSYSFNDNSNLSEFSPRPEQTSSLSVNLSYRYRYNPDWLFGATYSPSYTMYHVGHYDYLSQSISPFVDYGTREDLWTFNYRLSQMKSLLSEEEVNTTTSYSLQRSRVLKDARQVSLSLDYQLYQGAATSRFDSKTYAFDGTFSRSLGRGMSDGLTYTLTYLDNVEDENEDAAYIGNGLSYNFSKWFNQQIVFSSNFSVNRNQYLNTDRFTRLANSTLPPTKRVTTLYGLNLSLSYRQSDRFRFFGSVAYQVNQSNLPVLVYIRGDGDTPDVIRPIRSDELVGVPLTSSSLGPYKKLTTSFGVSINF